ncbi:teneurin-m [Galendromus occidentalis]|uniref:Teneurin-m n=1 Tax=Galendromus occidentalis TaxID=34638 RepID=A0AAJ7SF97_9ACAR|nr:teneurin-m [Galendromus occidentalis]
MEALNRGNRLLRNQSQEWRQDSSSDNEEDLRANAKAAAQGMSMSHHHEYEEPRNVVEARKISLDAGRNGTGLKGRKGSTPNGTTNGSFSSMEMINARGYGVSNPPTEDFQPPPQYPGYGTGSLPRQNGTKGSSRHRSNGHARQNGANRSNRTGNESLGLRRGPSSSSTSDNQSEYTDSETAHLPVNAQSRRMVAASRDSTLRDSPPDPAPPNVPPRNNYSTADSLRARLAGYMENGQDILDDDREYMTDVLGHYATPDVTNPEDQLRNSINRRENERVYCQPQNIITQQESKLSDKDSSGGGSTERSHAGVLPSAIQTAVLGSATYSNTIPVYCTTPCSTTGPMVPVPNCINPQLIQQSINAAAAAELQAQQQQQQQQQSTPPGRPFSALFNSATIESSRIHLQKACGGHRCSWRLATLGLLMISVVLATLAGYFAATPSVDHSNCIMVGGVTDETALQHIPPCVDRTSVSSDFQAVKGASQASTGCRLIPHQAESFNQIKLGDEMTHTIAPQESWNIWFNHHEPSFVRFNVTTQQGCKLALFAGKNNPPTLTVNAFRETISSEAPQVAEFHMSTKSRRAVGMTLEEVELIHYLEAGTWYLSIINDDFLETTMAVTATVASDVSSDCPNGCSGHGNCEMGKCKCHPGFSGSDCSDSVCPTLCNGHGRFVQGVCRCESGWKGVECGVPEKECEVPDCNGNGRCSNRGQCVCKPGFSGAACERVDCLDPSCSGHGVCSAGLCHCKIGWRGQNCSDPDDRLNRCFPDCSQHGVYDLETEKCICFDHWAGSDCSRAKCNLDCGPFGRCEEGRCRCDSGWTGNKCDLKECDPRCQLHGQCNNGTCVCIQGWMGKHCTIEGCPSSCSNKGACVKDESASSWRCNCQSGWGGNDCSVRQETKCKDEVDNDGDGLMDCADSECCYRPECQDSLLCIHSPEPQDILLRKQPPPVTASFYQKMKFLIEEDSVQSYSHKDEYSESQFWSAFVKSRVSVIRGRVIGREGNGLIGIRVSVATDPQFGFTLTRPDGWFDILVNGGGAVTLQFQRNPFHPIKRTIMVPWNDIVVMSPVVMMSVAQDPNEGEAMFEEQSGCLVHDYDRMKPIVYQTWRPGSQGGCTERTAIIAETQVIQEALPIPGSDLRLVYQSSHSQGYLSTIHLQLTPSVVPKELKLVQLRIVVEGILFENTFEADPDIKFTFAWNKRNVYKQKVYGLTTVLVYVGYQYTTCDKTVWTSQSTTLRGFDMDISELGQWNLDIHHRYNFHEGVLQKGDGSTVYFKHQPRVIQTLIGTGRKRTSRICPECNGRAQGNKLENPITLTSGPDGSIYVGDHNLIRRITPSGQVYTVYTLKNLPDQLTYQYHIALSPTDGHLYISDPEMYQIVRVQLDKHMEAVEGNTADSVVGNGKRCVDPDIDLCGDGTGAMEAKLHYPKGLAFSVDNTLYFADGPRIRMVNKRGVIHTVIGGPRGRHQWRPIPCVGTLPIEQTKLRWPTELAINPVDNSLYFIDDHMIIKLTKDKRVTAIVGQPSYCKESKSKTNKYDKNASKNLGTLISFSFGPTGIMYLAEVDHRDNYKVHALHPDGEMLHFAGRERPAHCMWMCPKNSNISTCKPCEESGSQLAVETRLHGISSLTVTSDGTVHIADVANFKILSAVPYLPEASGDNEYQIAFPENHEIYVFNKYGQHILTKSALTGKTKYTFLYNVNTSLGKLSAVTDASGNKVAFLRDSANNMFSIETARGQKCRVFVNKQKQLLSFTNADNLQYNFEYESVTGLLTSRHDSNGMTFHYIYDENGRLTSVVRPSGKIVELEFDLSDRGAAVSAKDEKSTDIVIVKGSRVTTTAGGVSLESTMHQDGAIEIRAPWKTSALWEAATHKVLNHLLAVQAGMFPIPVKQTVYTEGEAGISNSLEWKYDVKYNRKERDAVTVSSVERTLLVNTSQYLTTEYDWMADREMVYNASRRPFLVIQYDTFSRPIQYLPTDTKVPLNIQYDRLGRPSGWSQGAMQESYTYDRSGLLSEVKLANEGKVHYVYEGLSKPTKVKLPSGREYLLKYDKNGGLESITTPKSTVHSYQILVTVGFYKLLYTPPGNHGPLTVYYNDRGQPILKIFPGDHGRVLYRYNNQSLLSAVVYGGGKTLTNYSSTGFVKSEAWSENDVEVKYDYFYDGAMLTQCVAKFYSKFQLTTANFHYQYDNWFRPKHIRARVGTLQFADIDLSYDAETGKREQFGLFRVFTQSPNDTVLADGVATFTQLTDGMGRIQHRGLLIAEKEVYSLDCTYGGNNNLVQSKTLMRLQGGSQMRTQNFSYDLDNQLIEMVGKDRWNFHYDDNGNIVTMRYMGNKIEILHDVGDRILRFGETPFVVNDRGFVVQRGEERFHYNVKGQLIKASGTRGKYEVKYFYDAQNRLAMRKDHFGNMTQFFYADLTRPHLVTHIYNNADGRSMSLIYDNNDFLIHILVNKDSYYVATDHNGSPTLIFDRYGEVIKEVLRGPYGHIIYDSTPTFYVPVDFQGGILDPLTLLLHIGDKVYDSLTGKWMTPRYENVLNHVNDIRHLHLYQFNNNDPVNLHKKQQNKFDTPDWIASQGIDIETMGLGRPSSVMRTANGFHDSRNNIDKFSVLPQLPSVPLISGYVCSVQRKLANFARLSSVDRSRVKQEDFLGANQLTTLHVPLGSGITISEMKGRAVVRSVDKANQINKDVYMAVFNNTQLVNLHLVMHGLDVFYFLKETTWKFDDDITQLQRLGSSINMTHHTDHGNQFSDIRIHTPYAVLSIRYGSQMAKEHQRILRHAKKHAVTQRWAQERELLSRDQTGQLEWTEKEKDDIIRTGSAPGYRGDYYHDVASYPELADDPANIVLHRNQKRDHDEM